MTQELVNVGNFRFVPEAEAARLHLEEAGITAFLSNAELVNMNWFYGNALGWVKIMVPEDQAIAARGLLDELAAQAKARRENTSAAADRGGCLACGAELPRGESRCPQCGWTFRGAESEPPEEPDEDDASPVSDEPSATDSSDHSGRAPAPLDLPAEEWAREEADSAAGARLLVFLVVGGVLFLWLLRLFYVKPQ